ncbi:SWIM zinc finger family protein [Corynebacterium epidermidicanis]|uniref:SWIM-type domain-containing protein n=1 Tax=Corynebacterium epidermidicanis TaxID=1050174 RepID=A0A0G3GNQ1_9CORY|nr:SWIM zinc finger family protein [Corynebacterium epidermidicanis]AKK02856.1 hypothetical protein CEPID_04930 [Corynebacterium epidermidicanis]
MADPKDKKPRPRDGNVIYVNFGNEKRVTSVPSGASSGASGAPARALRTVRGQSEPQAFVRSIYQDFTDPGRISRGLDYFRLGNVVGLSVSRDRVVASVAGSQNEPFSVAISFPRRGSEELEEVTAQLLSHAGALADAKRGRLSPGMVDMLLASDTSEVRVSCDCPDRSLCCKHGVAVLEAFAEKIEADPALLFNLRGLSFTQLELAMQAEAKRRVDKAAEEHNPTRFWDGSELPDLPTPKVAPAIDDSDLDALHQAMRTVTYSAIDELRAVADIEELYDFLVDR